MAKRSPFRILAVKEVSRIFSDLIGVRTKFGTFEKGLIEGTFELIWMEMFNSDSPDWKRTTRVVFHFLDQGILKNAEKVSKAFMRSVNHIVPALNKSWDKRRKAKDWKGKDSDTIIENYLACYKTMYEGMVPVILGPVVYSFSIAKNVKNFPYKIGPDGKISLNAIYKMEKWLIYPQNLLKIGLNNHIRNAYSHENYRILDGGRVELWDRNPQKPRKKWGPEIWDIESLNNLCDHLFQNALGVVIALALFSANYRQLMTGRGWMDVIPKPPPLRVKEIELLAGKIANDLSFDLEKFEKLGDEVILILKTRLRGIDQEEEILAGGGEGPPRMWKLKVEYQESLIVEQLLGFSQRLEQFLDGIFKITFNIQSSRDIILGQVSIETDKISQIGSPKEGTLKGARALFEKDDLGDSTMFVKIEYPPVEV